MKKTLLSATTIIILISSQAAYAQAYTQEIKVYYAALGAGLYNVEYTESRPTSQLSVKKSSVPAGLLKVGVDADLWGAELRLGLMGSTTSNPFGVGTLGSATPFKINLQASPFFSYLGKLQYPFTDNFKAYVLFGGTMANFSITPTGTTTLLNSSATKTGFTYGIGAEYKPTSDYSIGIEWIQYWTNVDMSLTTAGRSRASFGGFGISGSKSFDF